MRDRTPNLIVGQGIAGTTLAWKLYLANESFVILNSDEPSTASKVAAGLVTPWTGRRMTQSHDFDDCWQEAVAFYRSVEDELEEELFEESSAIRLFVRKSDAEKHVERTESQGVASVEPWSGTLQAGGPEFDGCRMRPAGRLNVKRYLQASADFFSERQQWYRHRLELPDGFVIAADGIHVPELKLTADRAIFCQGAARNPYFAGVPDNPAKGEVLNVTVVGYRQRDAIHHSIWLAPERDGTLTAGATYDWKNADTRPTARGRREILNAMRRFVEGEILLNEHQAAVRPTMSDYQPVIGRHPTEKRLFIFNGLGSRGVLRAPRAARILVDVLTGKSTSIPKELDVERLNADSVRRSLTQIAQEHIEKHIRPGDTVVDATVGNGFDTCFLAKEVGPTGRVYGFDIQEQAIASTRRRLEAGNFANVELIADSHERLSHHLGSSIAAAMFNLGYLPRSDHAVVTQVSSTIAALDQVMERLQPGGVITILAYRGHDGGPEEAAAVKQWLANQPDCSVERIETTAGSETAPVLFVLQRDIADCANSA